MTITLTSDRPARHSRAVMFACDGVYAAFAFHAAAQIAELHPDRDFDICLVSSEDRLETPPGLERHGLRLCHVTAPGMFDGLRLDPGRTPVVYLRLALPAAFADDYARMLYLDADVFIQGGDFGALMGVDLGPHFVGAVRDNTQWRTPGRRAEQFKRLGLPATRYFNAGVMLIDVAGWNASGLLDRCVALGRANREVMIRHDQNLLNSVLAGDWAELSPVWNWQYTWASRMFEAMADANVVHFIGPKKPWKHDGGEIPLRFRRAYRGFLAEHFPDAPQVGPDGVPPMENAAFLRRSLVKHLVSAGRMSAYLARFPDELTVIA